MAVNLFWYGCNMTRHGEIIRLSARFLEALGVPARPVGGPSACCGSPKEDTPRIAEGMANRTMARFNGSGAERVITWCPSCHGNIEDFMAPTQGARFGHAHLAEAIHEQREALRPLLTHRVPARVFIDRHAGFQERAPVNTLIAELLAMIPGVEVVEHPHRAPSYMCFALANLPGALAANQRATLDAMAETGADTLVTIFHSCHREMVGLEKTHPIRVLNWIHLLAEGAGWSYADAYKTWRNSDDPLAAIGAERVAAAGEEAVRKLVEPELTRARLV
ncbi:MAG: (Fe-S)-binding protein [Acetobacteraceae bacterium]|nr:(Fe-S)-binding protein [Acetobacteraceae bacterium]